MFEVEVGKKPGKNIKKMDEKTRKKIYSVFETLEMNPWPARDYDLSKIEGLEDCFRIRVGKYRINYHVNTDLRKITVYRIERKKERASKG
ncbi:MAG: type II toxin-antitoxin system RelE/ParE family toxin [Candidatus Micrarchaeota archaeon]